MQGCTYWGHSSQLASTVAGNDIGHNAMWSKCNKDYEYLVEQNIISHKKWGKQEIFIPSWKIKTFSVEKRIHTWSSGQGIKKQTSYIWKLSQQQLNSKVGFDTKMTLDHHHKLNVINISPVPDPILTKL